MYSSIKENGVRIEGTKASDAVVETVLKQGKDYLQSDVKIADAEYTVCYMPIKKNGTDEIIGMAFAGIKLTISFIELTLSLVELTTSFVLFVTLSTEIVFTLICVNALNNAMNESISDIRGVIDLIMDVASQTKLLSINASIDPVRLHLNPVSEISSHLLLNLV